MTWRMLLLTAMTLANGGCSALDAGPDESPVAGAAGAAHSGDVAAMPRPASADEKPAPPATAAAIASDSNPPSEQPVDQQSMEQLVEELAAAGALEPTTKSDLLANLRQSDPATWPQLREYLRASLARRKAARVDAVATDTPVASATKPIATAAPTTRRELPATAVEPLKAQSPRDLIAPDKPSETPVATRIATPDEPTAAAAVATDTLAARPREEISSDSERPAASEPASHAAADTHADRTDTEPARTNWRDHLAAAIADLESQSESGENAEDNSAAALRLMYLVDGRRDDALRPASGLSAEAQEFWSQQVYGLSAYLDAERTPSAERRATEAVTHLREASDRLAELSNLRVRNLSLCTKVAGYGDYQRFERNEFSPGQEVVLYAELENFKSQSTDRGYKTAFACTVEVLDGQGQRVAEEKFRVAEQNRQTPRRDFFLSCHFWMPKRLQSGTYVLRLSVEDELGRKTDQSTIDVSIRAN